MKKYLAIISSIGLVTTGTIAATCVVSCSKSPSNLLLLKGDDLIINSEILKNDYSIDNVKQKIVDVINTRFVLNENGKKVDANSSGRVNFTIDDFSFDDTSKDYPINENTDFKKDVKIKVTPKTKKGKVLHNSATFIIKKKTQ